MFFKSIKPSFLILIELMLQVNEYYFLNYLFVNQFNTLIS